MSHENSLIWVGGRHSVGETLRAKPQTVRELWVEHQVNNPEVAEIIRMAREARVKVQFMARPEIDRAVAGGRHQGVAIKVERGPAATLADFLETLTDAKKKGMVLVALDEIQDPHNLGAIARSAANLGAAALILPERRTSPISQVAIQASAGAIQKLAVYKVVNLVQGLQRCRAAGFWIYGADAKGKAAFDAKLNTPLVLVIGSEGYGIRKLVGDTCDELISIPESPGGVSSFNASCAASILLYEIARQNRPA